MAKWPIVGYDGTLQQHGVNNRYLAFGGDFQSNSAEAFTQQELRDTYTASNLRLYLSSWVGGAGVDDMIATLRIDTGAGIGDGNQTITINATGEHEDTSNTDSLTSGDLIDLECDHSAGGHNDEYTVQSFQVTLDAASNVPPIMGAAVWPFSASAEYGTLAGAFVNQTTETNVEYTMRASRTLIDFRVYVTAHTTQGAITVRKNQTDPASGLTVSPSGTGETLDTANSVSYVAGDEANIATDSTAVMTLSVWSVEADTSSSVLMGRMGVGSSATWFAFNAAAPATTEAFSQAEAEEAATIQNLYINCITHNETRTIRSRKNAANGNLSVSVTGTGVFEDTSNSDTLAAEDDLSIQQDVGSSGSNDYVMGIEWETDVVTTQTINAAPVALTLSAVTPTVAASGSVSMAAAPIVMTLSVVTPAVDPISVAITATPVVLTLIVVDPAMAPAGAAPITAAPVVLTLSVVTPGVLGSGAVSITAAPVVMTLSVITPTVTPISVAITAAPLSMVLTVVDPAVAPAGSAPITAAPIVLTLSVVTPGMAASGQVALTPAALGMVLSVITPVLAFGAATLAPVPVVLTITPVDPALSPISVAMTAAPVVLTLSVVTPTVAPSGAVALTVAPVALTLSVVTPGMAAAGSVSLTAVPVVLTLTVVDPGLTAGALLLVPVPVALALTAVTPALAASGSVAMSATPVGLTLTVVDPVLTAAGSVAISAAALALALTVVDPSLAPAGFVSVSPAALGMSLAVVDPALTAAGVATLTPAALAMLLGVVDPTVAAAGSVSLTPAALGMLLSIPTPGISTVLFLAPAPVVLTLTPDRPLVVIGNRVFQYVPGQRWPPVLCVSPEDILCGASPHLERRADGSYVLVP